MRNFVLSAVDIPLNGIDGLIVLVMGMVITFLVLLLLISIVKIISSILNAKKAVAEPLITNAVEATEIIQVNEDEEVVAAITAAVYAVLKSESPNKVVAPFKIRKIKRY